MKTPFTVAVPGIANIGMGGGIWYEYSPTISATEYKHVAVIYIEYE